MVIKKIVFFAFIIISFFIISELVSSIYNLWKKHDLAGSANSVLTREKKKNAQLRERLKIVTEPQFIEQEARNKLFLVKPDEKIVVVAPTAYQKSSSDIKARVIDIRPNWKKWRDLFFKSQNL